MDLKKQEEWFLNNLKIIWINKLRLLTELANKKEELEKSSLFQEIREIEKTLFSLNREEKEQKELAKSFLLEKNIKSFKTLFGDEIKLKETPWILVIDDESIKELSEYRKEKITFSIDKKQLKEDIKQGLIIDWVYIKKDFILDVKLN